MSTKCPHFKIRLCVFLMQGRWGLKYSFFIYLFILFIFNNGLGFTGTQGSRLSEIWASFVPMLYITDLSSKMSSHGFNHMNYAQFFFFFFIWALGPHGLDHTQKAFPPNCKPTLVLLGKLVPQLSCPASFFFFFFKPHSYKSLGFLVNANSIRRTWCFTG